MIIDDMIEWISQHFDRRESGIVYCLTRKDCEAVCAQLEERNVSAGFYHADMDPVARSNVHLAWTRRAFLLQEGGGASRLSPITPVPAVHECCRKTLSTDNT